jgi:hypothetical protein
MRPAIVLIGLALAAAGCGKDDEGAATSQVPTFAELTVSVDHDGDGAGKARTTQVKCTPATDSVECAALAEMKPRAFAPTAGTVACTEQYGGPQTAVVKGTLHGKPVDARFSRINGCEIARWNAVADVLGAAG